MKLRNEARTLLRKALSSLRRGVTAFNSPDDDGRVTTVLWSFHHAFEMLLKATLVQQRVQVFDRKTGRAIGFEKCIRLAEQHAAIKLLPEEAGTLRTIAALRDDEQHWMNTVEEGILYVHARAAVTLFDDLLNRVFSERLADHLAPRVLPISTEAPQDFAVLVDREYANVAALLKPGRRARADAHARIRTLLAMEAHADPDTRVSERDVARVERAVRQGKTRAQVFPKLSAVGMASTGSGLQVEVRFVKQGGMPVRLVRDGEADDLPDVGAYREVDLQKRYHRSGFELADALNLTRPRATALREHLGIDNDERCLHTFRFGSQLHPRYSDNAFTAMRTALDAGVDMDVIWHAHRPTRAGGVKPACTVSGCRRNRTASSQAS